MTKKRLVNLITRHPVYVVVAVGVTGYLVVLAFFSASDVGNQKIIFQTAGQTGVIYTLTLTGVDHTAGRLLFDLKANLPEGQKNVSKCIWLNYHIDTSHGSTSSANTEVVNLEEVARNTLPSREQPGPGFTQYRGSGTFYFESDLRKFPFDSIRFEGWFDSQCFNPNVQLDTTPVKELWIVNKIADYQLVQQANSRELKLVRNGSLRALAILLLVLGFASAVTLIVKARSGIPDLSLLTYFVGLWGVRRILLDQIQGYKAFPTLIEVTIIFLFCFTLVGMAAARLTSPKDAS